MAKQRSEHLDPVVVAMERVLEAERAAETKLQTCRQQADALVTAARERAAAIGRRADLRITKLHTAYLEKVREDIATLSSPAAGEAQLVEGAINDADLISAGRRLAAKLTGDS